LEITVKSGSRIGSDIMDMDFLAGFGQNRSSGKT
jgi:hypothetical protein